MLAGCIIDNDPIRVESLTADTPATFTYDAWTNGNDGNDDDTAEQIRRDGLAEALAAHGQATLGASCKPAYVYTRRIVFMIA